MREGEALPDPHHVPGGARVQVAQQHRGDLQGLAGIKVDTT